MDDREIEAHFNKIQDQLQQIINYLTEDDELDEEEETPETTITQKENE